MSASLNLYWVGITDDQREGQPGFYNDDNAWAAFLANVHGGDAEAVAARVGLRTLDLDPLLSHTTEGMTDGEVAWTTADALEAAALQLSELVEAEGPSVTAIVALYERDANGVDEPGVELRRDLGDIVTHARWAKAERVFHSITGPLVAGGGWATSGEA